MEGAGAITIPAGARYTEADVRFMQGMIAHHAQAIYMSRMATARGASDRVQRFAQKIDQVQESEIVLMQGWLRAHNQMAPDTNSWRGMMMAGMLTPAQLATLEAPPPEMQQLLAAVHGNQQAMDAFVSVISGVVSPAEYFSQENIGTIFAAAAAAAADAPALAGSVR